MGITGESETVESVWFVSMLGWFGTRSTLVVMLRVVFMDVGCGIGQCLTDGWGYGWMWRGG